MNYPEATKWKWPGKNFAFRDCDRPESFVPIGDNWDVIPTTEEIIAAEAEYVAFLESSLKFDTGLGFKLTIDGETQSNMVKLNSLIDAAAHQGISMATVSFNADGAKQTISVVEFKAMIVSYGIKCLNVMGLA